MTIYQSGKICKPLILLGYFAMVLVTWQCQICKMVKFWISFGKAQTFFKRNFDQRKLGYIILKPFIHSHIQVCQNVKKYNQKRIKYRIVNCADHEKRGLRSKNGLYNIYRNERGKVWMLFCKALSLKNLQRCPES